ncbi:hypothetical protein C7H84_33720 [Burkholderia sp. Nafp2/4-1b]|nr:hypothetical protein C7H84_33720 [Burkholderia sp. Nafp2/4-1b]
MPSSFRDLSWVTDTVVVELELGNIETSTCVPGDFYAIAVDWSGPYDSFFTVPTFFRSLGITFLI